jgi:hypothetical protein
MPRWLFLAIPLVLGADDRPASPADAEFFEKNVRPVLVESCLKCHSADKPKSGLRLDTRAMMLKGGDGGAVVNPGNPKGSRLIEAVRHSGDLKMPPSGKLPARSIAALEEWVRRGAPWPAKVQLAPPDSIEKASANHWAFQPVVRPEVPKNKGQITNPVDAFVFAKLSDSGLTLSPAADAG